MRGRSGVAKLTVVVALALATVACGREAGSDRGSAGHDDTTTTTIERTEWSSALDASCVTLNRRYGQLSTADPADRTDAIAYAGDVSAFAGELVILVRRSGTPSKDRVALGELADRVDELAAAAADLKAAAQRGDAADTTSATDRLTTAGEAINVLAETLDVPACGGF